MKPEEEIVELKAKIASLENRIDLIKRNLQVKFISEQELDEYKERVHFLEDQMTSFKHARDTHGITTNPEYPPYIPYIGPTTVDSKFTPSGWQSCESHKLE
jgi:hypothetical protein